MYGYCKTSAGQQMRACYKLTSSASTGSFFFGGGGRDSKGYGQKNWQYGKMTDQKRSEDDEC